jgi:dTDP-4-dehydrorhamnose reductase
LLALDRHSTSHCGDLGRPEELAQTVLNYKPDFIVNAAAHTAVDKAESEPEVARCLNTDAPTALAKAAAQVGAWLVHYSTDYVFDGSGSHARQEDEDAGPLSVYGQTKLDGEQAIVASGCKHLIFRTSWVYAARGGNFAKTMLRLAQERERMTVINDQFGAPTGAALLAEVTALALQAPNPLTGIHHLAAAGQTTWYAYAEYVLAKAKQLKPSLNYAVKDFVAVPTSDFPTPATRTLNSRLNCSRLELALHMTLPPWQAGVDAMLAKIL